MEIRKNRRCWHLLVDDATIFHSEASEVVSMFSGWNWDLDLELFREERDAESDKGQNG